MILKFPPRNKLALVLAVSAAIGIGLVVSPAEAAGKRRPVTETNSAYGPGGPNVSYQAGPRTRVYISKRSWLDAGTEVLPGDRKFTDYAFPPGRSFGMQNNNRPLDRQPLSPPSDLGGYPQTFPLY